MKVTPHSIVEVEKGHIAPLKVRQAVVGLGLDDSDDTVLKYLSYLTGHISVESACFVHVIPAIYLFDEKKGIAASDFEKYELDSKVVDQIASKINSRIAKKHQVDVKFDVREGNPLDELMKSAEEENADFIVIGKSTEEDGHGILAKNFARNLEVKALIVPDQSKEAMRKILVPVDFSPNSIEALRTAIAISKSFERPPSVIALNVYELPSIQAYLLRKSADEMREILLEDRRSAFKSFIKNYVPAEDQKILKTDIIEQKHPGVGNFIMDYAEAHHTDLIVMGAKGHSKVGLLLLGSVTEKILGLTKHIPVLVVK